MGLRFAPHSPQLWKPIGLAGAALFFRRARPCRPMSVSFPRRRSNGTPRATTKGEKSLKKDHNELDDLDEDAFEALFNQLEEDLKNDNFDEVDFDDELAEEDLARLEQELAEAFGDNDIVLDANIQDNSNEIEDDNEDEEEDEPVKIKTWQLRRLASALKAGRHKTSLLIEPLNDTEVCGFVQIKSLAAELSLDRALVLELLRDPPPNLLLMSASLPDKVATVPREPDPKTAELENDAINMYMAGPAVGAEPLLDSKTPVFVMQDKWSTKNQLKKSQIGTLERVYGCTKRQRLKKSQIGTLERVYGCTKRPTNAMINNIVYLTNLPRKVVIKWFEDKRSEDGVPDQRMPFRRKVPDAMQEFSMDQILESQLLDYHVDIRGFITQEVFGPEEYKFTVEDEQFTQWKDEIQDSGRNKSRWSRPLAPFA